jgi:hypothetical protein
MRSRECQSRYPLGEGKAKIKVAIGGIVERRTQADRICDHSFVDRVQCEIFSVELNVVFPYSQNIIFQV